MGRERGGSVTAVGRSGPATVVPTKLRSPAMPRTLVDRQRLVRLLTDDPPPVTLICGPPGAGKTTLLASWLADHRDPDLRVAWLDLDRHDNDVFLLWDAVLAALRSSGAFSQDDRLHAMQPPEGGPDGAFLAELMAAIERLEQPLCFVLDNVHELTDARALASLDLVLRRLPRSLRLVLSSRTDPPLGFQRLRLADELREIRIDDLAFTHDEAEQLLEQHAIALDDRATDALLERTEGWAAGLQIAALALVDDPDPEAFLERFDGDERAVADYLVEEVLRRQTVESQRLLLETSTCSQIPLDLAERLTGRPDVGQVLDRLTRDNALTVLVGAQEPTYRYHELLRSYLQAELRRRDRREFTRLHRLAADWYDARGDGAHALEHAVLAKDGELASTLLRRFGVGLLLDGHAAQLEGLLDTPDPSWANTPVPTLLRAAITLQDIDLDRSGPTLLPVIGAAPTGDDPWLAALHATVGLHRARLDGTTTAALAHASTTTAGETGDEDLDLLALRQRGTSRAWTGDYRAAEDDLERAVDMASARGRDAIAVACLSVLAGAASALSDFRRVRRYSDRALELAVARGWNLSPIAANAHVSRAFTSYLRLDLEDASQHATSAMECLRPHMDAPVELGARGLRALVDVDLGADPFDALCRIRDAWDDVAGREVGPGIHAFSVPPEIRLSLMAGEPGWAAEAAQRTLSRFPEHGEAALVSAQLLAARGRADAAREALEPILRQEVPCLVTLTEVAAWLFAAEHDAARGLDGRAFESVVTALRIAEAGELLRPFTEAGPAIRELLVANVGRFGRTEEFVASILDLEATTHRPANPLTATERSLLEDLPSMLTLSEIARAKHVSINTVKTHLRAIYTKLDSNNRRGAVQEARRRGLL